LTDKLLHDFKNQITTLTLVPSGGGVFEVTVNGNVVHSKKATNEFPTEDGIVAALENMNGA
jgi:selenoprotein W-related protein